MFVPLGSEWVDGQGFGGSFVIEPYGCYSRHEQDLTRRLPVDTQIDYTGSHQHLERE